MRNEAGRGRKEKGKKKAGKKEEAVRADGSEGCCVALCQKVENGGGELLNEGKKTRPLRSQLSRMKGKGTPELLKGVRPKAASRRHPSYLGQRKETRNPRPKPGGEEGEENLATRLGRGHP